MPQQKRKIARRKTGTTYAAVEKMLLGWPGVEQSTSYGRPSLKIKGKFYTWVKEDGDSIVIGGIGFDERDVLMETARIPQKWTPVLRLEYAQIIFRAFSYGKPASTLPENARGTSSTSPTTTATRATC